MKTYEQLFIFPCESHVSTSLKKENIKEVSDTSIISEKFKDDFNIMDVPYIGCDFESIYPKVFQLLPKEIITFDDFSVDTAIMCEIICSAICHQINWDFLRLRIYEKTIKEPEWINSNNLMQINSNDVFSLLHDYHKPENIKAGERSQILHLLGGWRMKHTNLLKVFLNNKQELRPYQQIYKMLCECSVFSSDPMGKKINLLFQKLDEITTLQGIANYAKPTIDYHLLRLYLRRGLIYARTKYALQYIGNPNVERKESTIAAIRELCSKVLNQISVYTTLNVSCVNLIEWHVARSICLRDKPDCNLTTKRGEWLKANFETCPFYNTCATRVYGISKMLLIKEPFYKGTSY